MAATRRDAGRRRLASVDAVGRLRHLPSTSLLALLRPGDALIANDAATLPASLAGVHQRTGRQIEVRLASQATLEPGSIRRVIAVVFGEGDFRQRTEDRPSPPPLHPGDVLALGPLRATVAGLVDHPRLVALQFDGTPLAIWSGLAAHGRPVQYAHVPEPLRLWDVWTPVAAVPAAFEPPSAGFALNWEIVAALGARDVAFATLTHAAGLSSTGDAELDARLPLDEPYCVPAATAALVRATRRRGGRIVAVGTSVVRALESAAGATGEVVSGPGMASLRLNRHSALRVVDALLSGTHEAGTSHHDLIGAFLPPAILARLDAALAGRGYRTHEFGDSVFLEKAAGVDGWWTAPADRPAPSAIGQRPGVLSAASACRQ